MISLSDDAVRWLRLHAQQFIARLPDTAQVVKAACGIQAQEVLAAALSNPGAQRRAGSG